MSPHNELMGAIVIHQKIIKKCLPALSRVRFQSRTHGLISTRRAVNDPTVKIANTFPSLAIVSYTSLWFTYFEHMIKKNLSCF